jgi:hypothetical protein
MMFEKKKGDGMCEQQTRLSSSAKADDPVITAASMFTGLPAFAGNDV